MLYVGKSPVCNMTQLGNGAPNACTKIGRCTALPNALMHAGHLSTTCSMSGRPTCGFLGLACVLGTRNGNCALADSPVNGNLHGHASFGIAAKKLFAYQ